MIKLVAAKVPRRLFSSLVLIVFVFSTFFSSSRDEKHHLIRLFIALYVLFQDEVSRCGCADLSLVFFHMRTQKHAEKASGGCGEARRRGGESERAGRAAEKCRGDSVSQRYEIITRVVSLR
jgi:hypothetical protein